MASIGTSGARKEGEEIRRGGFSDEESIDWTSTSSVEERRPEERNTGSRSRVDNDDDDIRSFDDDDDYGDDDNDHEYDDSNRDGSDSESYVNANNNNDDSEKEEDEESDSDRSCARSSTVSFGECHCQGSAFISLFSQWSLIACKHDRPNVALHLQRLKINQCSCEV